MSDHIENAVRLAPVIERVHGSHHPELTRVRELTEQLPTTTEPESIFRELREVTNNYALPDGACEAFTATYTALKAADAEHATTHV